MRLSIRTVLVPAVFAAGPVGLGGEVALTLAAAADPKPGVVARSSEEAPYHLGALVADRPTVPLGRVSQQLDLKLRSLARAGLFKDMPTTFQLNLSVDASGAVISVGFDRPCGKAAKLVEVQLLGWRFDTWTAPGTTKLSQPVQVPP
jgi:hypothetical protein